MSAKKIVRDNWRLEDHCCRVCFGRVVSHEIDGDDLKRTYQCTNCGLEVDGPKPNVICACGTKLHRKGSGAIDAGLRCHVNQKKTPELPSVIVASIGGAQV